MKVSIKYSGSVEYLSREHYSMLFSLYVGKVIRIPLQHVYIKIKSLRFFPCTLRISNSMEY